MKRVREIFADEHGRVDETNLIKIAKMYIGLVRQSGERENLTTSDLEMFFRARPEHADVLYDFLTKH